MYQRSVGAHLRADRNSKAAFDGELRYVLLSAEGAPHGSLGWSEAEPQESAIPWGQALKERLSPLGKWNPARIICRSYRAPSIFYLFPGAPLRCTPGYLPGAPSALKITTRAENLPSPKPEHLIILAVLLALLMPPERQPFSITSVAALMARMFWPASNARFRFKD
jgi:hypothetical protein